MRAKKYKMNRKDILNQVKLKLNSGYTKQETFDELDKLKVTPSIELAKIIKLLPTKAQKEKLKIIQYMCLITYSGIISINIIQVMNGTINFSSFNTIIYLFISFMIFVGMSTFNPFFYILSALITSISLLGFATKIGLNHFTIFDYLNCLLELFLIPSAIFMFLKLQNKFVEKSVKISENEFETKIVFEDK